MNKFVYLIKFLFAGLYFKFKFSNDSDRIHYPAAIRVVFINLDQSADRRAHMEKLLDARRIVDPVRIKAVRYQPESFDKSIYNRIFKRLKDPKYDKRRPGVVGNYLSHRRAMEFIGSESRFTLILEDDVYFTDAFLPVVSWFANNLPEFWDIIIFDPFGAWKNRDRIKRFLYRPSASYPY